MTLLYGRIDSWTSAKAALKNMAKVVAQHAFHNCVVAAVYVSLTLSLASLRKQPLANKPSWRSFYKLNSFGESILAGLIAGSTAFRLDQSAVALQVSHLLIAKHEPHCATTNHH